MTNHCRNGHALTEDNVYISKKGHRVCRSCRRIGKSMTKGNGIRVVADLPEMRPTDDMFDDAARRSSAPRDITSILCGDPPPGYSALDLKSSTA